MFVSIRVAGAKRLMHWAASARVVWQRTHGSQDWAPLGALHSIT